ncbi:hypothetical protein [Mesorhizobium sp. KR1-2]|uniref:hypothetical protein n=1 Tax=Mesorhizobium sp. KR1-2 TaxID=3156609 RepID=UPI0032B405E0
MGYNFKSLERKTGLPYAQIRALVRDLASEGYLTLMRGCFTEDGEPYGSAYVLTDDGFRALEAGGRDA